MRRTTICLVLIGAIGGAGVGLAQDSEGRRMAEQVFDTLDTAQRGFIDQGEFMNFGGDVFFSMDTDQNGKLSLAEFLVWDIGMRPLAVEAGREAAYDTAMRVVFAFWDRNGDGEISRTEHRQSLGYDFQRADLDNDALLDREEFLGGFSVNVALRAAINPEPVE